MLTKKEKNMNGEFFGFSTVIGFVAMMIAAQFVKETDNVVFVVTALAWISGLIAGLGF